MTLFTYTVDLLSGHECTIVVEHVEAYGFDKLGGNSHEAYRVRMVSGTMHYMHREDGEKLVALLTKA